MIPGNMTMDELIVEGINSSNPVLHELSNRLSGRGDGVPDTLYASSAVGRTIRKIKEDVGIVILIFTDGSYFVIEAEAFNNDDVDFKMGRKLSRSELYVHNLMTPAEAQIYRDEQEISETKRKAKRLEYLRKELAELEK